MKSCTAHGTASEEAAAVKTISVERYGIERFDLEMDGKEAAALARLAVSEFGWQAAKAKCDPDSWEWFIEVVKGDLKMNFWNPGHLVIHGVV